MATLEITKKQIEKALNKIISVPNICGRIDITYELPLTGSNMNERLENFDKMLEGIEINGLNKCEHIFSRKGLTIYVCSRISN